MGWRSALGRGTPYSRSGLKLAHTSIYPYFASNHYQTNKVDLTDPAPLASLHPGRSLLSRYPMIPRLAPCCHPRIFFWTDYLFRSFDAHPPYTTPSFGRSVCPWCFFPLFFHQALCFFLDCFLMGHKKTNNYRVRLYGYTLIQTHQAPNLSHRRGITRRMLHYSSSLALPSLLLRRFHPLLLTLLPLGPPTLNLPPQK